MKEEPWALACPDQATFEKVWGRVMAGKPNPIVVGKACEKPTIPQEAEGLPCFGQESEGAFLTQAIESNAAALEDYEKLDRQLPQKLKPTLQPLVQARKKAENQLTSAYFLLTGTEFHPVQSLEYPIPVPADQRLRHRFQEAQRWQGRYQKQAVYTQDTCLTSLYCLLEQGMHGGQT